MADKDIQALIDQINSAVRGEDVRNAIIQLLEMANTGTANAYSLNGLDSSMYAKQSDMDQILPLASTPTENGTRPVSSGGLYYYLNNIITAINVILQDQSSGTISSKIKDLAEIRYDLMTALNEKGQATYTHDSFSEFAQKVRNITTASNFETETLNVTKNDTYVPEEGHAYTTVKVEVKPDLMTKTITAPGTYKAKDDDKDGYSEVTVSLSTGGSGSEEAALVSKTIDISNLPEPGSSSLTKTFHPSDDGAKAVGYSEVTVNLDSIVGECPTINIDPSQVEEQTFEAATDGLYGYSKVTIKIKEQEGPFTVEFWNGSTKMPFEATGVERGQDVVYGGETPIPPSSDMVFDGWNPEPRNVTKNMKCYAQFRKKSTYHGFDREAEQSWDEIGRNGGADVEIGQYKLLPYNGFDYNGEAYSGGVLIMMKVASGEDGTTSTWLSVNTIGHGYSTSTQSSFYFYNHPGDFSADNKHGYVGSDLATMLNGVFRSNAIGSYNSEETGNTGQIATYMKPVRKWTSSWSGDSTAHPEPNLMSKETIWIPSRYELSNHIYNSDSWLIETQGTKYTVNTDAVLPAGYSMNIFNNAFSRTMIRHDNTASMIDYYTINLATGQGQSGSYGHFIYYDKRDGVENRDTSSKMPICIGFCT